MHTDEELVDLLDQRIDTQIDAGLATVKKDLLLLKQRSSRPPGTSPAFADPDAVFRRPPSAGLAESSAFREFVATSTTRRSSFAAELPFQVKTITGVTLPTPIPGIVGAPVFPLRLAQLMVHLPVATGSVTYVQETAFTSAASANVPEGTRKPTSTFTFAVKTLAIQTAATIAKCSLQALRDTTDMANWIDARLSHSVLLAQENFLLNDSVSGLLTVAPVQTPTTGATALDMVAEAIGSLKALGYNVDGIVMNPNDVTNTRLLKDSQGRYLWASADSAIAASSMWNIPLVESPSMPAKSFLVGSFSQSTILFDREVLIIEISFENEDDFVNNLSTFRCEMRFALGTPLVNGLLKGTLP
jgi:HK97 family phage major capsid protein